MIDITALIWFITVCSLFVFLHLVAQTSKKIDQDASRRSQWRFWHNNNRVVACTNFNAATRTMEAFYEHK